MTAGLKPISVSPLCAVPTGLRGKWGRRSGGSSSVVWTSPYPGLPFSPLHTYFLGLPLSSAAFCLIASRPPAALRTEIHLYPSPSFPGHSAQSPWALAPLSPHLCNLEAVQLMVTARASPLSLSQVMRPELLINFQAAGISGRIVRQPSCPG